MHLFLIRSTSFEYSSCHSRAMFPQRKKNSPHLINKGTILLLVVTIVSLGSVATESLTSERSARSEVAKEGVRMSPGGGVVSSGRGEALARRRNGERMRRGGGGGGGKSRERIRRPVTANILAGTANPDPFPCRPRLQAVALPSPPPDKFYVPSCAVVKRCTGCCSVEAIECIPKPGVKQGKVKRQTNEYSMGADGKWKFTGVVTFVLPSHKKCTCGCKIRAKHCTQMQSYDPSNCRCRCNNHSESMTCEAPRFWDHTDCACRCPSNTTGCSTGSYMDPEKCRCISKETIVKNYKPSNGLDFPDIYRI